LFLLRVVVDDEDDECNDDVIRGPWPFLDAADDSSASSMVAMVWRLTTVTTTTTTTTTTTAGGAAGAGAGAGGALRPLAHHNVLPYIVYVL
jgi:hypothetical protein